MEAKDRKDFIIYLERHKATCLILRAEDSTITRQELYVPENVLPLAMFIHSHLPSSQCGKPRLSGTLLTGTFMKAQLF
jgi:hypothetical protein